MPHPLQMLHGNHSLSVKVKLGIKVMNLVESLIGWEVTVGQGSDLKNGLWLRVCHGRFHVHGLIFARASRNTKQARNTK